MFSSCGFKTWRMFMFLNQVSSFSTKLEKDKENKVVDDAPKGPEGWDCQDVARWENCLKRDFTVNGYVIQLLMAKHFIDLE